MTTETIVGLTDKISAAFQAGLDLGMKFASTGTTNNVVVTAVKKTTKGKNSLKGLKWKVDSKGERKYFKKDGTPVTL